MSKTRKRASLLINPEWRKKQPVRANSQTAVVPHRKRPVRRQSPTVVNIPSYSPAQPTANTLSTYMLVGAQYHPICRHSFIERVELGYYHYERRTEWRTCAIAAAYAGMFGARSVETSEFSISMALWRLKQVLGYDLRKTIITDPEGATGSIESACIRLIDVHGWSRPGVAQWLETEGL